MKHTMRRKGLMFFMRWKIGVGVCSFPGFGSKALPEFKFKGQGWFGAFASPASVRFSGSGRPGTGAPLPSRNASRGVADVGVPFPDKAS